MSSNNKKNSIKVLFLGLALIILGTVGLFFFKTPGRINLKENLNSIFDPNKPIVVRSNGKYGYITSDRKTIIEPKYNSADDFYGDYAIVTVDNPDTNAYNKSIYQIIDKSGNVKLTSNRYLSPMYFPEFDMWLVEGILYNSNLKKVLAEGITVDYIDYEYFEYSDSVKNECGIMTYKGKKIFTMPGISISADISDNYYSEDDLYATVTSYHEPRKDVVISLKTGDVLFTSQDPENYYITEDDNGLFYYYNHTVDNGYKNKKYLFFIDNKLAYQTTAKVDDVEVYDYQNQILVIDYGDEYEELGKTQSTYYYDIKNQKMLETRPTFSNSTSDLELELTEKEYGFKKYSSSGKYGLMSGEKVILPCEYDDIEYLNMDLFNYMKSKDKELILLEKEKELILYNLKTSKAITTFKSKYAYDYEDSTFIKVNLYEEDFYTQTGYTVYNLLSDKSMNFGKDEEIIIGSNYLVVKKDGKRTYYNTDFKEIYKSNE